MNDYVLLLSLLLVHITADFFLQPTGWVSNRALHHWRTKTLYYHSLIHLLLSFIVIAYWQYTQWLTFGFINAAGWALLIAISHLMIDLFKSYRTGLRYFIADQLLHLFVILFVWLTLTDYSKIYLQNITAILLKPEHLLLLLAYLIILKPTSVFIVLLLNKVTINAANNANGSVASAPAAGHLIGLTERTLILTLILAEQYSAVGLVIAAKSVLRFSDLKDSHDRALTEYILLGSLLSFTLTLFVALAVLWLYPQLTL